MKYLLTLIIFSVSYVMCQAQHLTSYPLKSVALTPGTKWSNNQKLDSAWIMSFPVKRLLHTFRTTAGVYSSEEGGYSGKKKIDRLGGWESLDCDLRGHAIGHLLSAYAIMYANTGNEAFKLKGDSLVAGIRECQEMIGTGYVSAYPEGLLHRNLEGKGVWAPWYTLHKIIAGLLQQYQLAGNATALDICKDFSEWTSRFLSDENLSRYIEPIRQAQDKPKVEKKVPATTIDEVRRRALRNEFGGMGEAFYDLYAITRNEATLRNAQYFYHNEKVDPLYASNYDMGTQHCNTFLPKMAAEIKSYELGVGQNPHADVKGSTYDMVNGFWHSIVSNHVLAPGCLSDKEHFFDPKTTSKHLTGNTGETCCTYNLLKLTRELYSLNPNDPAYFDYYERALYNHILGQQDPETGMVHYFLPTQTGAYKLYSTYDRSFWCCVGSSFESHAKYGESIYWHSASNDTVYVNLFIPSTLTADGMTLQMQTDFPSSDKVSLNINSDRNFVLMVRQPSWTLRQAQGKLKSAYKAYKIKKGQRKIDFSLPMTLHTEATPDDPNRIALFYGPILLAGQLGHVDNPNSDPTKHNDYYGFDYKVPSDLKTRKLNVSGLKRTGPLEWLTEDGIKVKPLYDTHRERYVTYWTR